MTSPVSAIEAITRTVALDIYHNAVDSDDGSHSMDMPVAIALITDAMTPLARQAEALKQEVDSLKQTRQHSREASAALHDTFMEERKRVEALQREKQALLSALATAEDALFWAARQHHEYGNTRAQKATELAAHACRRTLLGGENAE